MAQYVPLTPQRHVSLAWKRYASYRHAAAEAVLPVVGPELPRAAVCLPIAFVTDTEGAYVPVAVLGPQPGVNVFVAPDGRWLAPYVPAELRSYPFKVAVTPEGAKVVCVDEASGLIVAKGEDAEAETFFDDDGKLTPSVGSVVELLQSLEAARPATLAAVRILSDHGLIQPWSVQMEIQGAVHSLAGLYRVDEAKMNQLPDEAYLTLRASGCIALAYAQLLSMQHIATLQVLAQAQAQVASARASTTTLAPGGELDLGFLKSDTIRF